mmetsp:Transcript_60276/g.170877  ORF Transcript_60276/g.170877 Transcript_60276/m.170877 type:complete len:325 (+) Transcript_60276:241-1215(+)
MLQNRPGSERGHQPQPRRALLALASASHSSDSLGGLPLAAKLRELLVRSGIRGEEGGLILREPLAMDLEAGIRLEDRVGGEVDDLGVVLAHVSEVGVVEHQPVLGPRPAARAQRLLALRGAPLGVCGALPGGGALCDGARAVGEGAADGVRAAECDDVLVGHAVVLVEDVAEVLRRTVGEGSGQAEGSRGQLRRGAVHAAVLHGDLRAAHDLHGRGAGELDEIGPRDDEAVLLELVLDRGQVNVQRLLQARVRRGVDLVGRADRADGAATVGETLALVGHVIGAGIVPGSADQDRAARLALDKLHALGVLGTEDAAKALEARHG